jgi:hypothetical protein
MLKYVPSCMLVLVAAWLLTMPPFMLAEAAEHQRSDVLNLKPDVSQPYIVKKGDTLWDIANHFFRDPMKWLNIWEKNLYITNPDLIYPGNKIWFDGAKTETGGLTTVRPKPAIRVKEVERLETPIDPSLLLTSLRRQDFIKAEDMQGVGYILDSEDDRINFGSDDRVYLKLDSPADEGDLFDIFRTADPIRDPESKEIVGVLVLHLGQVEITSSAGNQIYRGLITKSFEEISRGDRLKPAKDINTRIVPVYPASQLNGRVLYIRNDATEAGQHQVIGISLGIRDGMQPGSVLSIHRPGRHIQDVVTGETVQLPGEMIGEVMVLVPQEVASIAIVTKSAASINIGDSVRNPAGK